MPIPKVKIIKPVKRKGWLFVDETPYQDEANELKKYYKEEGYKEKEIKIKMIYGKIHDPGRPLFRIYIKRK